MKPSGNSSGPYEIGFGSGWGVGERTGSGVDEGRIVVGVIVGSRGSPGCVAVEVPLVQAAMSKKSRGKRIILRFLGTNSPICGSLSSKAGLTCERTIINSCLPIAVTLPQQAERTVAANCQRSAR